MNERQFWIGVIVSLIVALPAVGSCIADFVDGPSAKEIASSMDTKEVAAQIDLEKLAEIVAAKTGSISSADLKVKNPTIPIPPRKPNISSLNDVPRVGLTKMNATCLMLAAQTYSVPPAVLVGIYKVENGELGKEYGPFKDGSYEIGLMRLNSKMIPVLAKKWDVAEETAHRWLRDDPCTNMGVAAWKLRNNINEDGNLAQAIANFRYDNDKEGHPYKAKVVQAMREAGLLRDANTNQ